MRWKLGSASESESRLSFKKPIPIPTPTPRNAVLALVFATGACSRRGMQASVPSVAGSCQRVDRSQSRKREEAEIVGPDLTGACLECGEGEGQGSAEELLAIGS
jgi:hypothetical protein